MAIDSGAAKPEAKATFGSKLTKYAQDDPVGFNMMMGAIKSEFVDKPNEQRAFNQEVINQQYSPFTGKQANFAGVKKANTFGSVLGGAGAGLAQLQKQNELEQTLKALKESRPEHNTYVGDNNAIVRPIAGQGFNLTGSDVAANLGQGARMGTSALRRNPAFSDIITPEQRFQRAGGVVER